MDSEGLKLWTAIAAFVVSIGNAIWAFAMRDVRAVGAKVKEIDERQDAVEVRVQTVEHELKYIPSKDEVNDIKLAIAELKGTLGRVDESLGSVTRTVRRIDDYLRGQKAQ